MTSNIETQKEIVDSFLEEARSILPGIEVEFAELHSGGDYSIDTIRIGGKLTGGIALSISAVQKLQELSEQFSSSGAFSVVFTLGSAPTSDVFIIPPAQGSSPASPSAGARAISPEEAEEQERMHHNWQSHVHLTQKFTALANLEKAELTGLKALEIAENFPPDDSRQSSTLETLADIYFRTEKYHLGAPVLVRLLQMYKRCMGPQHPDTATIAQNLGMVYHCWGELREAQKLYAWAREVKVEILGEEHPDVVKLQSHYNRLLQQLGIKIEVSPAEEREPRRDALSKTGQFDAIAAEEFNPEGTLTESIRSRYENL